jgi:hypothetical protein
MQRLHTANRGCSIQLSSDKVLCTLLRVAYLTGSGLQWSHIKTPFYPAAITVTHTNRVHLMRGSVYVISVVCTSRNPVYATSILWIYRYKMCQSVTPRILPQITGYFCWLIIALNYISIILYIIIASINTHGAFGGL